MTRRYTGGFLSSTEQATDANSANGIFTLSEAAEKTALGNFPTGRWTPQRSLRFRNDAPAYLARTPTTTSNQQVLTISVWLKRGKLGSPQNLFQAYASSNTYSYLYFQTGDTLNFANLVGGVGKGDITTNAVFRDTSAWYHIVLSINYATPSVNIYVNGVLQTLSVTTALSASNFSWNTANVSNFIGSNSGPANLFDGYMAEVNFIDGQQLTPSSFAQTDAATGAWIPKRYTGSYGTNGFYLPLDPNYNVSPGTTFNADFVVVAGGGGGANGYGSPGPGGGAGGFRTSAGTSGGGAAAESSIGLNLSTAYSIIVGAGGTGGTGASGIASKGSISRFSNIISFGGGAGYSPGITDNWTPAGLGQGGSGSGGDTTTVANGTLGQGSNGGLSRNGSGGLSSGDGYNGGGGGGASAAGANSTSGSAGAGGNGQATSISGSSVTYGGGGAGANDSARVNGPASGGTGGGGSSVYGGAGNNGSTNTGGGGAGGSNRAASGGSGYAGGNGGSGIVIIKIPNTYTATFSGGVTSSLSTSVSGYKIYTVTATSTTSETVTFS